MPSATIIRADHPHYWRWQAAVARHRATCLGYAYDPDGVKKAAFTSWVQSIRRNPEIGEMSSVILGDDFLSKALDDYAYWPRAWWREAIQNCVDAGATNIDMTLKQVEGKWEVAVTDNGVGMTADILFNKFMSLGSTGKKKTPTATGGFGEAKRLLLFPWCTWSILTNGEEGPIGIEGKGFSYKRVAFSSDGPGTRLIITMPDDKHVTEADAEWFIGKCWLPNIKITLNGKRLHADLDIGHQVDFAPDDIVKLYHSPIAHSTRGFFVRKNGLLMYEKYTDEKTLKGVLIGEIIPPSVEVLRSNRDGMQYSYERGLDAFLQSLAKDTGSKLRRTKCEKKMFQGSQKIMAVVEDTAGRLNIILGEHFAAASNAKLTERASKDLELAIAAIPQASDPGVFMPTPGVASLIMEGVDRTSTTEIEAATHHLVWPADFYIVNEIEDFEVPKRFRPDFMDPKPRKLARLWLEYCRLCLIRLGYKGRFGIGWIFSTNDRTNTGYTRAAFLKDQGVNWLLLNPFVGGNIKEAKLYSVREERHLNDLFSSALHECTHLVNGVGEHDESFSSALTENISIVMPSMKLTKRIRDVVGMRPEPEPSLEKAKGMGDLAEDILRVATAMETSTDLRIEGYDILEASKGFASLRTSGEKWQQSLGLGNPSFEFRNVLRYIVQTFRDQGMSKMATVAKILDTVPKEICPETLAFHEFKMGIAYWIWRDYA